MKKVIDFLKSKVVIFLVLLICAGFVGADLYKLWVLGEKTRFIIPTSIILGYFLVLFFADGDGASYQAKKEKILQKYSKLEPDHVFIVQFEIESWYLAGVNKVFCDKNKIKHYYNNTDSVTKEMFNEAIKTCNETKLSIMLKMLNIYDCLLADTRNTSFSSFFSKNMSICQ